MTRVKDPNPKQMDGLAETVIETFKGAYNEDRPKDVRQLKPAKSQVGVGMPLIPKARLTKVRMNDPNHAEGFNRVTKTLLYLEDRAAWGVGDVLDSKSWVVLHRLPKSVTEPTSLYNPELRRWASHTRRELHNMKFRHLKIYSTALSDNLPLQFCPDLTMKQFLRECDFMEAYSLPIDDLSATIEFNPPIVPATPRKVARKRTAKFSPVSRNTRRRMDDPQYEIISADAKGKRSDEVENDNLDFVASLEIPFEAPTLFRSPRVASHMAQIKNKNVLQARAHPNKKDAADNVTNEMRESESNEGNKTEIVGNEENMEEEDVNKDLGNDHDVDEPPKVGYKPSPRVTRSKAKRLNPALPLLKKRRSRKSVPARLDPENVPESLETCIPTPDTTSTEATSKEITSSTETASSDHGASTAHTEAPPECKNDEELVDSTLDGDDDREDGEIIDDDEEDFNGSEAGKIPTEATPTSTSPPKSVAPSILDGIRDPRLRDPRIRARILQGKPSTEDEETLPAPPLPEKMPEPDPPPLPEDEPESDDAMSSDDDYRFVKKKPVKKKEVDKELVYKSPLESLAEVEPESRYKRRPVPIKPMVIQPMEPVASSSQPRDFCNSNYNASHDEQPDMMKPRWSADNYMEFDDTYLEKKWATRGPWSQTTADSGTDSFNRLVQNKDFRGAESASTSQDERYLSWKDAKYDNPNFTSTDDPAVVAYPKRNSMPNWNQTQMLQGTYQGWGTRNQTFQGEDASTSTSFQRNNSASWNRYQSPSNEASGSSSSHYQGRNKWKNFSNTSNNYPGSYSGDYDTSNDAKYSRPDDRSKPWSKPYKDGRDFRAKSCSNDDKYYRRYPKDERDSKTYKSSSTYNNYHDNSKFSNKSQYRSYDNLRD